MHALWYASLAAQAVLLGRLQFIRILPIFRVYLLIALIRSGLLLALAGSSYTAVWTATEPVLLVLQFAVAVECLRRVRASYPDIGPVAEIVLWACSIAAMIACAVSIAPDLHNADWTRPVLTATAIAKRVLSTILAVLLVAVLWSIRKIRAHVPRNTLAHARILAAYFGANAVPYALRYWGVLGWRAGSDVVLSGVTVCFAVWAVALSRAGETAPPPSRVVTEAELDASGRVFDAHVRAVESVYRPT
jgi:hypothetical protein